MSSFIPVPTTKFTGSDFVKFTKNFSREKREEQFLVFLLEGQIPDRLRNLVEIRHVFVDVNGLHRVVEYKTFNDYLQIGTDEDSFIAPINANSAEVLNKEWDCILPTTRMVELNWQYAKGRVNPQPWGPPYDASMMSTDRIIAQQAKIDKTFARENINRNELVAGHKKDIVNTNKLKLKKNENKIAIFGWHRKNGKPIQPLYLGHVKHYGDYSHGCRPAVNSDNHTKLDDCPTTLRRILADKIVHECLSSEGTMDYLI